MSTRSDSWRNSTVVGSAIVAAVSLLTLAVDGCRSSSLQRTQFQSQVILQGLEAGSREETIRYFELITDLGLLDDEGLENRLDTLAQDPERIPQLSSTAPTAVDDTFTVDDIWRSTFNVLENDLSPYGLDLDIASIGSPSDGTIEDYDSETGDVTYRPPREPGTYLFDYTVTNGRETDGATVIVRVE